MIDLSAQLPMTSAAAIPPKQIQISSVALEAVRAQSIKIFKVTSLHNFDGLEEAPMNLLTLIAEASPAASARARAVALSNFLTGTPRQRFADL